MRLRRIGKIDVHARVSGNDTISTGFVFYSYAKNSNALEFHFKDQQGRPVDLLGTRVRLLLIVKDNGEDKEFKTLDEEIVTESSLNGIVRYIIPDRLMGYQGIVDGWIYLDFPDGSKTDELHFKFTIERSKIDQEAPLIRDFYVPLFEEIVDSIKAELSSDAEKAKNDISQMVIDTQKIAQEEQEKIQAELPKLQVEVDDLNTAVNDTIQKVDELKQTLMLHTAYKMYDGSFTLLYPNENQFMRSESPSPFTTYLGSVVTKTENVEVPEWGATNAVGYKVTGGTNVIAGTLRSGMPSTPANEPYDYDISIYIKNTGTTNLSITGNFTPSVPIAPGEAKRVSWVMKNYSHPVGAAKQFVIQHVAGEEINFVVWKAKIALGSYTSIWTPRPDEDYEKAHPKWQGIALQSSDDPNDYQWRFSDDYRDFKEEQLKQAIIALGGTVG